MLDNRLEIIVEIPNSAISSPDNPNGVTRYNLDTFPPEQQEPIELNFCINDINDISNRNASSSKTITLPETNNNREVFGFISDLNLEVNTFSPNKRSKCYVMLDTVVVFEGWLQLKNVKPNYRTGLTKLECVVYSNQLDFFKAVGESYLQDLSTGFRRLTYTFSAYGITSSWYEGQSDTDIYYPLIDYGISYNKQYQEEASSFNSLSIGLTGNGFVNYNQMFPSVYLKSIIDAIFLGASGSSYQDPKTGAVSTITYQYDSNFFNSAWFSNIIIPYNNGLLTTKEYLNYTTESIQTATFSSGPVETHYISIDTANGLGLQVIKENVSINGVFYPNMPPYTVNFTNINVYQYISSQVNANFSINIGTTIFYNDNSHTCDLCLNFINVTQKQVSSVKVWNFPSTSGDYYTINEQNILFTTGLNNGDQFFFTISRGSGYAYATSNFTDFYFNYSIQSNEILTLPIILDCSFNINKILPANVKQKDFLNTIFKMFNLYVDYDPNVPTILRIEPRDDYYYYTGSQSNFYGNPGWSVNNLVIKDWSDKVDINQDVNIQLLAETQNKTIRLTYKEDKDYFNDNYTGFTGRIYGEKIIEIDNDFNFGEQVIDVLFGPTTLANIPGSYNFPIPNLTKQIDTTTNVPFGRSNANIKIMQRGIKTTKEVGPQHLFSQTSVDIDLTNQISWIATPNSTDSDLFIYTSSGSSPYSYYTYIGDLQQDFSFNIKLEFSGVTIGQYIRVYGYKNSGLGGGTTFMDQLYTVNNTTFFINLSSIVTLNTNDYVSFYIQSDNYLGELYQYELRGYLMVYSFAEDAGPVLLNPGGLSYSNDKWRMGTTSSDAISYNYYPYAGNINDPFIYLFEPDNVIDLNFDNSLFTYYSAGNIIPTKNLYNTFYQNQFNEILDINSKIITAQLYLTPQDIRDFRFSDVIYLRLGSSGQYYHVNKINNYSLTQPQKTVEVELIKIKEIAAYALPPL